MTGIVKIKQAAAVDGNEVMVTLTDGRIIAFTLAQVLTLDYQTLSPDEADEM